MNNCISIGDLFSDSDFEWFLPSPKNDEYLITIPNDYNFNFSQKLLSTGESKVFNTKKPANLL
ncbi:MAG TPA: hypothetical protein VN258_02530 [Mobilitalea sp.]|nr:hypothetical protein [Mobilitalea sp.]